ncbi:hypothetical protein BDZ88DRAFT_509917 [Geranomyces variabilis]|nr:hypothetical protein BDZ88DRAFT_509917 [Geranomyces variabilis]KAJ3140302.1 hypothetical protein HDU90_008530 [Geranomyces variabilis]
MMLRATLGRIVPRTTALAGRAVALPLSRAHQPRLHLVVSARTNTSTTASETVSPSSSSTQHFQTSREDAPLDYGSRDGVDAERDAPTAAQGTKSNPGEKPKGSRAPNAASALFMPSNNAGHAMSRFYQMDKAGTLKNWTQFDYQHLIGRLYDLTGAQNPKHFVAIHDIMLKNNVAFTPAVLLTLVNVYCDADWRLAAAFWRNEEKIKQHRERNPSETNDEFAHATAALNRDRKRGSDRTYVKRAEDLVTQAFDKQTWTGAKIVNELFRMFANRRDIASVERWVQIVGESSVRPTPSTYRFIINAYGQVGDVYNAQIWFENYLSANLPRQAPVFEAFAEALAKDGQIGAARDILEKKMIEHNVTPNIFSYTTLLTILVRGGKVFDAKNLLTKLENEDNVPRPDFQTYSAVFEEAVAGNHFELAKDMFGKLKAEYRFRSSEALSDYGRLCLERGALDEAEAVYNFSYEKTGYPEWTFTTDLIAALLAAKNTPAVVALFEKAYSFMQPRSALNKTAARDPNFKYLVPAATAAAEGNVALLLKLSDAVLQYSLWQVRPQPRDILFREYDRQRENLQLTVNDYDVLYNTLASFYGLINGQHHLRTIHRYAFTFLDDMIARGLKPTRRISDTAFKAFEARKMFPAMQQWKQRMVEFEIKTPEIDSPQAAEGEAPISFARDDRAAAERELIELGSKLDTKAALAVFDKMADKKHLPTEHVLQQLILACGRARNLDGISHILKRTLATAELMPSERRLQYQNVLARGMVRAYLGHGWVQDAVNIMEQMKQTFGRNPFRPRDYERLVHAALQRYSQSPSAEQLDLIASKFAEYEEHWTAASADRRATYEAQVSAAHTHCLVLRVMQEGGRIEEANQIWNNILARKLPVSDQQYSDVISGFGRQGEVKSAEAVFEHYVDEHWESLSMSVLNAMIATYSVAGLAADARRVFKIAENRNLPIGSETFEMMICALATGDGGAQLAEVLALKDRMQELKLAVPANAYEALLRGTNAENDLERLEALMNEIKATRIKPTAGVIAAAVEGAVAQGKMELAQQYRNMLATFRIAPTSKIDNAMIRGFLAAKDFVAANNVFTRMSASNRVAATYEMMVEGAVQSGKVDTAQALLDDMKASGADASDDAVITRLQSLIAGAQQGVSA